MALAGVLAVVLFVGVGTHSGQTEVAPGITADGRVPAPTPSGDAGGSRPVGSP